MPKQNNKQDMNLEYELLIANIETVAVDLSEKIECGDNIRTELLLKACQALISKIILVQDLLHQNGNIREYLSPIAITLSEIWNKCQEKIASLLVQGKYKTVSDFALISGEILLMIGKINRILTPEKL